MPEPDPTQPCEVADAEAVYPLRVGDRVFDRRQIEDPDHEPELAIVIECVDEDVYERTFSTHTGDDVVLADYAPNQRYADFDESVGVVRVVWSKWLNAHAPEWVTVADDPEALLEFLHERADGWSVPIFKNAYDYPEARLRLAHRPSDGA